MKKLYYFIILLFASMNLSAEVFIDEPFDTWLPEGWSVIEGSGGSYYSHWFHRDDQYATVYVTSDDQDEWLITPEITLPTEGDLRLSADMMGAPYRMITLDAGDFYVNISTDNGVTWETIWKEDDQAMVEASGVEFPWLHNTWFFPSISLNDYAGQTIIIGFRYVSPDGEADWWNLDNIMVKSLMQNEVELQEFNFPEYGLINDTYSFEGIFKNFGENEVTSFEVVYSVNGIESDPYTIEGISVPHNTTYNFTHNVPYTFENTELYDLSLEITKVNGQIDPIQGNNIIYKDISIATEYLTRKPMFEMFTSSTCSSCPYINEVLDGVLANNTGNYSLVKYQVNWPGDGDPYYIEDCGIRVDYYGVGGVPHLNVNGATNEGTFSQSVFNAATNEGAMSTMEIDYEFDGLNLTVDVQITPTLTIEEAAVHIAVVEKTTYNNVSTNGETEFHNVLMKMLPGPNGTIFNLYPGETINFSESANLIETFIEEFDDLQAVVWLQDNETKYILQSESVDLTINVGVDDIMQQDITLSPNPTNGIFTMKGIGECNVEIMDIEGKVVRELFSPNYLATMDISNLKPGMYIVKVLKGNEIVYYQKIILK